MGNMLVDFEKGSKLVKVIMSRIRSIKIFLLFLMCVTLACSEKGDLSSFNDGEETSIGEEGDEYSSGFSDIDNRLYEYYSNWLWGQKIDSLKWEYNMKLNHYCYIMDNGMMELRLSEGEALALGVPSDFYNGIIESIKRSNEFFERQKSDKIYGIKELNEYYDAIRSGELDQTKEYVHPPKVPSIRKRLSKR